MWIKRGAVSIKCWSRTCHLKISAKLTPSKSGRHSSWKACAPVSRTMGLRSVSMGCTVQILLRHCITVQGSLWALFLQLRVELSAALDQFVPRGNSNSPKAVTSPLMGLHISVSSRAPAYQEALAKVGLVVPCLSNETPSSHLFNTIRCSTWMQL